ncbi:MAG: HAD family hydrolase [bacterium]|nr:HAD family hydrolase [bacterium]
MAAEDATSSKKRVAVLATDLDGTLIPLQGDRANRQDLAILSDAFKQNDITLLFVTGRHFESVLGAMGEYALPEPEWVICDVGTSIYFKTDAEGYRLVREFHDYQAEITGGQSASQIRELFAEIAGLRFQEDEKQGEFKLSFYSIASELSVRVAQIDAVLAAHGLPYSVVQSVDPFNNDGLIDVLPRGISKAAALNWWSEHCGRKKEEIVFAGDSGNDLAALTAGFRSILVGNADRQLAKQVHDAHVQSSTVELLYLAQGHATSGVLEGLRWFESSLGDERT